MDPDYKSQYNYQPIYQQTFPIGLQQVPYPYERVLTKPNNPISNSYPARPKQNLQKSPGIKLPLASSYMPVVVTKRPASASGELISNNNKKKKKIYKTLFKT